MYCSSKPSHAFLTKDLPARMGHTHLMKSNWINCAILSGLVMMSLVILQEKKLVAEIKKTAKTGNEVSLLGCCGRFAI